jgi:hypothetical protein
LEITPGILFYTRKLSDPKSSVPYTVLRIPTVGHFSMILQAKFVLYCQKPINVENFPALLTFLITVLAVREVGNDLENGEFIINKC